jgi:hypothetical protein
MTNRRKEVTLRYRTEHDAEIKEVHISENDTPHSVLLKLKAASNFHIADDGGHPFEMDDNLFWLLYLRSQSTSKVASRLGFDFKEMSRSNSEERQPNRT